MDRNILKFTALLSAAAFLFTGCESKSKDTVPTAKVEEYSKNDLYKTVSVDGTVESTDKDTAITTELVEYKVKALNYKVGDTVNAGDIVCELDTTDLEKEIADLESNISNTDVLSDYQFQQYQKALENAKKSGELQLSQARKEIDDANAEYSRKKDEYNKNIQLYNNLNAAAEENKNAAQNCSDPQQAESYYAQYQENIRAASEAMNAYESAYSEMLTAENSIASCQNNYDSVKLSTDNDIEQAKYKIDTYSISSGNTSENKEKLDRLKRSLENSKIKAIKSGVVSTVTAEVGKICSNGAVMTTQSTSDICIHVTIKEEDLLSVKSGMKALVTTSATGNKEFEGTVDRILDIKSQDGFDGYITINDTDDFRIGMTTKVKIVTTDESDVLSVNNISLFTNDDGKTCVYEAVKQSNDSYTVTETVVSIQTKTPKYTEITADSLQEGDLILTDPKKHSDGDKVQISKAEKKSETGEDNARTE